MNEIERDFRTQSQHLLWSVWRGLLVGVTAGAVVSLFRWLIAKGAAFSVAIYKDALHNSLLILGIVLVNLLIALFIGYLIKQEKDIKGSGIPHVEGELMGLLHPSWWSVLWSPIEIPRTPPRNLRHKTDHQDGCKSPISSPSTWGIPEPFMSFSCLIR